MKRSKLTSFALAALFAIGFTACGESIDPLEEIMADTELNGLSFETGETDGKQRKGPSRDN